MKAVKDVSFAIECKKVYYINNDELVTKIDKLISDFKAEEDGGTITTLDEDRPKEGPRG